MPPQHSRVDVGAVRCIHNRYARLGAQGIGAITIDHSEACRYLLSGQANLPKIPGRPGLAQRLERQLANIHGEY